MMFLLKLEDESLVGYVGQDFSLYWCSKSVGKMLGYKCIPYFAKMFSIFCIEDIVSDQFVSHFTEQELKSKVIDHNSMLYQLRSNKKMKENNVIMFNALNGCDFHVLVSDKRCYHPCLTQCGKEQVNATKFQVWLEKYKLFNYASPNVDPRMMPSTVLHLVPPFEAQVPMITQPLVQVPQGLPRPSNPPQHASNVTPMVHQQPSNSRPPPLPSSPMVHQQGSSSPARSTSMPRKSPGYGLASPRSAPIPRSYSAYPTPHSPDYSPPSSPPPRTSNSPNYSPSSPPPRKSNSPSYSPSSPFNRKTNSPSYSPVCPPPRKSNSPSYSPVSPPPRKSNSPGYSSVSPPPRKSNSPGYSPVSPPPRKSNSPGYSPVSPPARKSNSPNYSPSSPICTPPNYSPPRTTLRARERWELYSENSTASDYSYHQQDGLSGPFDSSVSFMMDAIPPTKIYFTHGSETRKYVLNA